MSRQTIPFHSEHERVKRQIENLLKDMTPQQIATARQTFWEIVHRTHRKGPDDFRATLPRFCLLFDQLPNLSSEAYAQNIITLEMSLDLLKRGRDNCPLGNTTVSAHPDGPELKP